MAARLKPVWWGSPPGLNQVERWFGIMTQRAIRRGSFSSVKELIAKIEQFVAAYNKALGPFNWTTTADTILEKFQRPCSQISGTAHEQARLEITCRRVCCEWNPLVRAS